MGNFQHLAEKIIKKSVCNNKVSSFLPLAEETGNCSQKNGNIERNSINKNNPNSLAAPRVSMETFEETGRKPPHQREETFIAKNLKKNSPSINLKITESNLLERFFNETTHHGLQLLPDDMRWIKAICYGVSSHKLKSLLEQYTYLWIHIMEKETSNQKQQNAGRFAANTLLREALATPIKKETT